MENWNPYVAPRPSTSDEVEELKKTPVLVVVFFTFITCGIYQPFWYWQRRRALNRMAPEKGVDGLCIAAFVLLGVGLAVGFWSGMVSEGAAPSPEVEVAIRFVNFAYAILMLALGFRVKGILEANYPDRISGVGVFFLNLFYLQYKINRLGQGEPQAVGLGLT